MFNHTLRTALLGSGAALALMAGPALAGQVEELKAQIDTLQSRLDQIEKQQAATETKLVAAPADAVVGGDFPGSFKLPGGDTSYAIHGYTKLDFIGDVDENLGDTFGYTGIHANPHVARNRDGVIQFGARQSRLTFETRTPTNYGQLKTFIQTDFRGGGGASTNLRLRHAYGVLGPVLAGQTSTNFLLDEGAETLDFNGPAGELASARRPQIRYTFSSGKWQASAAIENPKAGNTASGAADVSTAAGGADPNTIGRMPDLTARVKYADSWGDVDASGVIRRLETDNGAVPPAVKLTDDTIAGGAALGGSLNLSALGAGGMFAKDSIGVMGYFGKGIGVYAGRGQFGASLNTVAVPGTVTIDTTTSFGGSAYATHYWTDQLRSNLAYGTDKQRFKGYVPVTTSQMDQVQTVHANLIWSPVKAVNIGIEFMYALKDFRKGALASDGSAAKDADAKRLQVALQYVF